MPTMLWALAAVAFTPSLDVGLDAENTFMAREERALGAMVAATLPVGPLTLDLQTSMGRDLPVLYGPAEAPLKLGGSGAVSLAAGDLTLALIGVVENGARRVDAAMTWRFFAIEVEGMSQVRLLVSLEL